MKSPKNFKSLGEFQINITKKNIRKKRLKPNLFYEWEKSQSNEKEKRNYIFLSLKTSCEIRNFRWTGTLLQEHAALLAKIFFNQWKLKH